MLREDVRMFDWGAVLPFLLVPLLGFSKGAQHPLTLIFTLGSRLAYHIGQEISSWATCLILCSLEREIGCILVYFFDYT